MAQLQAFRIQNFRSIIDTDWVQFSPDGVTVLVGQNESGKTSVLQALNYALTSSELTADDLPVSAVDATPNVQLRVKLDATELDVPDDHFEISDLETLKNYLLSNEHVLTIECTWNLEKANDGRLAYEMYIGMVDESELSERLARNDILFTPLTPQSDTAPPPDPTSASGPVRLSVDDVAVLVYETLPGAVFFDADSGLLPNTVDIDSNGTPTGDGATAAENFLRIAEIDLPKLVKGDGIYRQNQLRRANQRVSDDFSSFWSQMIGGSSRLSLQCEISNYGSTAGEKVGKEHLVFWIVDGNTHLHPKQRSLGVRWFVSFYLQLRASKKLGSQRVFLLDEPGANLHAKAQADVLKLVNELRNDITIVYSTHSPQMIEYEKLYRVRAVQRDGDCEDSPTIVIDGHHLGAASTDTLSPILFAMGSDMSNQAVIKKVRNVLLEEMSGYYYLKSFWRLTSCDEVAHFIAATGVNKLPTLVNMFLGWGLDFVVAVDDDKQGRDVFNQLKKDLFGDQDELARKQLLKIPDCTSIEEAFSPADFKRHIVGNEEADVSAGNAEYLKANHLSKPVTAFQFWLSVESGKFSLNDFEPQTIKRIEKIVNSLQTLLSVRPAA